MSPRENDHDDFILTLLANDEQQAIKILFDQYYPVLYNVVYQSIRHRPDTDEIVQNFFIYLWQSRHHITIKKPLRRYLIKAILNRTRNFLRDTKRQKKIYQHIIETTAMHRANESTHSDSDVNLSDINELSERAMQQMTARVRQTYVLSRKHDMSYAEIAAALGITRHTVARNIVEALKVMRTILKSYTNIMLIICMNTLG